MDALWLHLAESPWWAWYLGGLAMMILEVLAPGIWFIWLGLGALAAGGVTHIAGGIAWQAQWLVFVLASGCAVFAGRKLFKLSPKSGNILNQRLRLYLGRTAVLDAPIRQGRGKIRLDGTLWSVQGADCPAGTIVRVTGIDGTQLVVEPEPLAAPSPKDGA